MRSFDWSLRQSLAGNGRTESGLFGGVFFFEIGKRNDFFLLSQRQDCSSRKRFIVKFFQNCSICTFTTFAESSTRKKKWTASKSSIILPHLPSHFHHVPSPLMARSVGSPPSTPSEAESSRSTRAREVFLASLPCLPTPAMALPCAATFPSAAALMRPLDLDLLSGRLPVQLPMLTLTLTPTTTNSKGRGTPPPLLQDGPCWDATNGLCMLCRDPYDGIYLK